MTTAPSAIEKSAIRKVSLRLVPFVALMFFINFLDRTAISFAGPNGLNQDLGLSAAQFGFAAGVFFLGYIFLEIPRNLALYRFGARRWLARIMVTWGVVTVALFLWSRDATRRGVRTWHVGIPALIGALSIPLALQMHSPVGIMAVITVTACAIFSALPVFWSMPGRFLSGVGAAAGIALINTIGNLAGFAAPFVTGALKASTGGFQVPMLIVGGLMLVSALLSFSLSGMAQTATLQP